jgi:hypothetical protein
VEEYDTDRYFIEVSKISHIRFACWITKAKNTHSLYVTLLAIPVQKWLHEHTSILRYRAFPALLNVKHDGTKKTTEF